MTQSQRVVLFWHMLSDPQITMRPGKRQLNDAKLISLHDTLPFLSVKSGKASLSPLSPVFCQLAILWPGKYFRTHSGKGLGFDLGFGLDNGSFSDSYQLPQMPLEIVANRTMRTINLILANLHKSQPSILSLFFFTSRI